MNSTRLNASFDSEASYNQLVFYITAEVVIALLAFLDNMFVIIAVYKFKHLRTTTYYLLACLAFADIGVAVIGIPGAIVLRIGLHLSDNILHLSSNNISEGEVNKSICLIIVSSVLFLTQVSIFSLLIIAVDRFIAIYYALRYKSIVTRSRIRTSIAFAWIFGALIGFLPQIAWSPGKREVNGNMTEVDRCEFEDIISMSYMVYFNFFACVLLPLTVMFILYILVFRSAKRQLRMIYYDVKVSRKWSFPRTSITSFSNSAQPTFKTKLFSFLCCKPNRLEARNPQIELLETNDNRRGHLPFRATLPSHEETDEESAALGDANLSGSIDRELTVKHAELQKSLSSPEMVLAKSLQENLTQMGTTFLSTPHNLDDLSSGVQHSQPPILNLGQSLESFRKTPRPDADKLQPVSRGSTLPSNFAASSEIWEMVNLSRLNSNASSYVTCRSDRGFGYGEKETVTRRKVKRKSQLLKKEFRAAKSLFTVIGLFAICWLPLHIINCLTLFCDTCHTAAWLKDAAILLSHANSLVNPIIYAFRLRDMKLAFQKIVRCSWSNEKSELRNQSARKNRRS